DSFLRDAGPAGSGVPRIPGQDLANDPCPCRRSHRPSSSQARWKLRGGVRQMNRTTALQAIKSDGRAAARLTFRTLAHVTVSASCQAASREDLAANTKRRTPVMIQLDGFGQRKGKSA